MESQRKASLCSNVHPFNLTAEKEMEKMRGLTGFGKLGRTDSTRRLMEKNQEDEVIPDGKTFISIHLGSRRKWPSSISSLCGVLSVE